MIRLDFVSNSSATTAIFPQPLTEEEMQDPAKVAEYQNSLRFANDINFLCAWHASMPAKSVVDSMIV